MIGIGLIGYGYWGPNLLRNFWNNPHCDVKAVADARQERLSLVGKQYPAITLTTNAKDLLHNSDVDAVVIATPVQTHYALAKEALQNGKHVLIEKPMTANSAEARELMELADSKGLTLMVDHTFLYTGAVAKIHELVDSGTIGDLAYFDSTRINLGLFQPDVNVLWDLAPHDLSILLHIEKRMPRSVNATGISHTANGIENIAFMTVNYDHDFIAHFNCSWTSPVKVRQTLIGGKQKMVVYNDLEPSEKIRVYDTGYKHNSEEEKVKIMVEYRTGDVYIPKIDTQEALYKMTLDFAAAIMEGKAPMASAELGCRVVMLLEAAQQSINANGKEIKL